ncbi:MAG: group III truncated hemoglobin [Flavobacterium sp.]|nr:group III truncated hemoglobin [Flavobacterium sp.]
MLKKITDRADVALLVDRFYAKVRQDEVIGPIFNGLISDWEEHLEKLTGFWTMNLFGTKSYSGNPMTAHQHADDATGSQISLYHFKIWLHYWFETIDEHYEGENAETLKRRAEKMHINLMAKILEHRNN